MLEIGDMNWLVELRALSDPAKFLISFVAAGVCTAVIYCVGWLVLRWRK